MHLHPRKSALARLALAAGLSACAWLLPHAASATTPVSYSGDAQVVDVDLELLSLKVPLLGNVLGNVLTTPVTLDLVKAGPLPPTGGYLHDHLLTIGDPALQQLLLTAEVAHALATGNGYDAYSESFVVNVTLGLGHAEPTLLVIKADVLRANAKASCKAGGGVDLRGGSELVGLSINGKAIAITGKPNQTIDVAGIATIIINEQFRSSTATAGSITVNALDVKLLRKDANLLTALLSSLLNGTVVIGHAHADIDNCPAVEPPCDASRQICTCDQLGTCPPCTMKDFVTGGGQVGSGSSKVTFSTHGGRRSDGGLVGSFNVVDHGRGTHYQDVAPGLWDYVIYDGTPKRDLKFYCDSANGSCLIKVADNGEPGNAGASGVDTWEFSAMGLPTLGSTGTAITHGNLQLHQPRGCSVTPAPNKVKGGRK